jgi:hypothetical protein
MQDSDPGFGEFAADARCRFAFLAAIEAMNEQREKPGLTAR